MATAQTDEFSAADFAAPQDEFSASDFGPTLITPDQVKPNPYESARMAALQSGNGVPMGPFGPETPDFTTALAEGAQSASRAAGKGFDVARKAIIAGLATAGQTMLDNPPHPRVIGLEAPATQLPPPDAGEPPTDIQALIRGEELPAISQRKVLPPVLRGIETGAQELVGSAPKLAAVTAAQAVGIPAPIAAGLVFGSTPEGFDPKQAAIAAALPVIGKWSGDAFEVLSTRLGVSSPEANAIINRLGGVAGVSAALTADQWNEIRKLPESQQKDAWADAVANIAGMAGLGAVMRGRLRLKSRVEPPDIEKMRRVGETPTPAEPVTAVTRPTRTGRTTIVSNRPLPPEVINPPTPTAAPTPAPAPPPPAPAPTAPTAPPAPKPSVTPEKAAAIKARIDAGIDPAHIQLTVTQGMDLGNGTKTPSYVQVDEIHPQLGNTFSSNPEYLNKAGLKLPTSEELLKLPAGKYMLPDALNRLEPVAETKAPESETKQPESVTDVTPEKAKEQLSEIVRPQKDLEKELRDDGWNVSPVKIAGSPNLVDYWDVHYRGHKVSEADSAEAGWKKIMDGELSAPTEPTEHEKEVSKELDERESAKSIMPVVKDLSNVISNSVLTKDIALSVMAKHHGGTMAEGKFTAKDMTDAVEMAINHWIQKNQINPAGADANTAIQTVLGLKEMLSRTPTQTTRSEEMDKLQQFSTPPMHAYVANWVANLTPTDVVLEPSAGVGGLAVFSKNAGARVIANELSPRRAALLGQMSVADNVTTHNAEIIHAHLARNELQPTAVIMNPPFSNAATTNQKSTMVGAKHVESALKMLPPGGRLVAIVGEGMALSAPAFKGWWSKIQKDYNVRANIHVSGKEYAKYGTHFGNQIVVIDNNGPTPSGGIVIGAVAKVEDLIPLLERIKNDRPKIEPTPAQPSSPPAAGAGAGAITPRPANVPAGPRPPGPSGPAGGTPAVRGSPPQGPGGLGIVPSPTGVSPAGTGRPAVPATSTPAASTPVLPVSGGNAPTSGIGEGGLTLAQHEAGEHELIEHGVFSEYKPRKVAIMGAKPHPTPLVETTAMASVEPVDPTYVPSIPQTLIDAGVISDVQLEQVVYAGQAFEKILPNGQRMGYFVGDGTGVGKTRIIGAIALDNKNRGRRKMVWVSVKKELIKDITNDIAPLGYKPEDITNVNKNGGAGLSDAKEGIAFVTYKSLTIGNNGLQPVDATQQGGPRTLRPSTEGTKSRLQRLYDWLGPDFDGVIAFDEAHKAGNAIDIKGTRGVQEASQTGMTVLDVQALFPKARVLYSSATGASSVTNLSYADRLGIWGEGTPWPDKNAFFNEIQAGGLSAMEIVARDLKSMGRYLARTLSFEGVEKTQLVHNLTTEQIQIYNQLSDAWQYVLAARNETMANTGAVNNGRARGQANGAFYRAQQAFYNQLLTAMQMPSVLADMKAKLDAGNTIVVSLVNTNEATLNREIAAKGAGAGEADENWLDDVDLSPKQILLQYIERSYPTILYQPETDTNGNTRWRPVTQRQPDGTEILVEDPAAVAKRQELMDRVALVQAPENPLELILNEFGHENVAELTGRKRRIIRKKQPDGTIKEVIDPRNDAKLAQEQKDVEEGKRRILVHSGKAGTGFTFSASRKFKNQQRRYWYGAQLGWRSDEALQSMGRVHRSDQASAPFYTLPSTNLKGHQRFISTIARRLAEMGALTGGERKGAGGDLFDETNNLETGYAEDAVDMLFRDLHRGDVQGMDFGDVSRQLGYTKTIRNDHTGELEVVNTLTDRGGGLNQSKIPTIQQFLNRILAMRFHDQNNLFDEFMDRLKSRIDRAKEDGSYDPGTQTLKAQNIKKLEDKVVYTHPSSTAKTRLVEIQYDQPVRTTTHDEVMKGRPVVKFVTNIRSGNIFALKEGPNKTLESGTIVPTYRRTGPGSNDLIARDAIDDFLQGSDAKFRIVPGDEAQAIWDKQLATTPKVRTLRDTYVVGAFLPIWDRLEIPDPKIWRITAGKETFLGAHVPPGMVRDVRTRLGAGSGEAASPEATFNDILVRNTKIELANGWELKRSRVQGEPRIEVLGMTYEEGKMFVDRFGGFQERIQYQPRYFIPTDETLGVQTLARVLKHSPPVSPDAPPPSDTPPDISMGPGGASWGDFPPTPPPAAGISSAPSWQRPNGIVTPSSPGLMAMIRNFDTWLLGTVRGMAGQWPARTTIADRESGEAMARYAAARSASQQAAKAFSTQALAGTGVDPSKLGEALVEDNLRSIRESLHGRESELIAEGKQAEADAVAQQAAQVVSLTGARGSSFETEDEYQDYLARGDVRQAIRQHIQQWEEVIDPMFKLAMRLDPDEILAARGLQTGARVNLKAVFPDEEGVKVVGRAGPSLTATFRRKSPFGRRATGSGQAYEVNYHELISNTFQRQLEIARKNEMDQKLVASGNAKIAPPGQTIEIAGERGIAFPLARQVVVLAGNPNKIISQARNIYVRQSLAGEYRTAANVDASFAIPVVTPIMNAFNRAALAGLTEFTVHMSNQFTALFLRPTSGPLLTDSLLSLFGRADVPVTLVRALIKSFGDHTQQLAELAEIGSLREERQTKNPLGRILQKTDRTTRLILDDTFQRLVESGIVPDTETARREYANAIGQYNKRMQGPLTRFLRETGFGPFVVAGKTFNVLGIKTMTLSPGTKATNAFAAAALRANMLAKWIGFVVLLGVLNYLLTKDKKGGPLGRKGVRLGDLDTGRTDKNGKPLSLPLMDIFGLGRGARVTGIRGYVQARYLGLSNGTALDAAAKDVINAAVGPVAGPGPRAATIMATGSAPAVGVPRTAPVAAPGQNQLALNIGAALGEANPVVKSILDVQGGKTLEQAAGRQFPRFAMRPGMEGEKAANMPKIVNAAQLNAYTEDLGKKARGMPLQQRYKFVQQKLTSDKLNPQNKARAMVILERQGVFKYK